MNSIVTIEMKKGSLELRGAGGTMRPAEGPRACKENRRTGNRALWDHKGQGTAFRPAEGWGSGVGWWGQQEGNWSAGSVRSGRRGTGRAGEMGLGPEGCWSGSRVLQGLGKQGWGWTAAGGEVEGLGGHWGWCEGTRRAGGTTRSASGLGEVKREQRTHQGNNEASEASALSTQPPGE